MLYLQIKYSLCTNDLMQFKSMLYLWFLIRLLSQTNFFIVVHETYITGEGVGYSLSLSLSLSL